MGKPYSRQFVQRFRRGMNRKADRSFAGQLMPLEFRCCSSRRVLLDPNVQQRLTPQEQLPPQYFRTDIDQCRLPFSTDFFQGCP